MNYMAMKGIDVLSAIVVALLICMLTWLHDRKDI